MTNSDSMASVAVLSRFYNPYILFIFSPSLLLLKLRVIIEEKFVLRVINTLDDVECEWKCIKDVHLFTLIIGTHVVEKSFFVTNIIVLLEMVVNYQARWILYSL